MTAMRSEEIHDPFTGGELDTTKWAPVQLPLPDGTLWECAEPQARTTVNDGTLTIEVPRFERRSAIQIFDNPKHLLISKDTFEVPASGRLTISARVGARSFNAAPRDYRDGFVALNVLEMATGKVFDLAATSDQVFAIHEQLPGYEDTVPFTRVVEDVVAFQAEPDREHLFSITLDPADQSVRWMVDDRLLFDVAIRSNFPTAVQIGLGLITLHPVGPEGSRSIKGQGLTGSFRELRVNTERY